MDALGVMRRFERAINEHDLEPVEEGRDGIDVQAAG